MISIKEKTEAAVLACMASLVMLVLKAYIYILVIE